MPRPRPWFWAAAPIPYALLAAALIDWLRIPVGVLVRDPWLALTSAAVSVNNTADLMWRLVVAQGLIAVVWIVRRDEPGRVVPIAVVTTACAVMVGMTYLVLVGYHEFDGYPPFLGACTALWIALSLTYLAAIFEHRWRLAVAIAGGVVVVATIYANVVYYRNQYPTLHAMLAMVTYLIGHAAATAALSTRPPPARWVRAVAPVSGVVLVGVIAGAFAGSSSPATAYTRAYTTAGQYEIFRGFGPVADQCLEPVEIPDDATARALFAEQSHMPALPAGFRLDEHNVLLIMIDATRFDDTSFGGTHATTPHLARLAADGAFSFEHAYAPSARTVVTAGSMFDMTYPTHTRMKAQVPPWAVSLSEDVDTPAELFAAAGYTTFRFTHQFPPRHVAAGMFQGFARNEAWPVHTPAQKRAADPAIADATIAELERVAATGERFFGWAFFFGGHVPYVGTAPKAGTKRGRYRQDIAFTDAQIGRVFEAMRTTGLLDTTVVIVMADHGEEFGEHGVNSHGLSLFEAGTRIPMLLWIPGVPGRTVREPTSAVYLWPALAATGTERMRALAASRIREHIAPMLAATGGAVVTELADWERHQTALVWRDTRAIYDFQSGLYQVFDRAADPGEHRNLAVADPDAARPFIEHLDRYRAIRACRLQVAITNERAPRR